jgi:predicted tellurium resistance membrane protein TerC
VEWIADPNAWISLATLTALEIVLGVDNIIFISILVGRLPEADRARARTIGLGLAMGSRILLLMSLAWIMKLTTPLFSMMERGISGRDLILVVGGLFLLWKSTHEIHNALEGDEEKGELNQAATFTSVILQIAVIDVVFSLDSVITAVGMANELWVMVTAVVASVLVMLVAAEPISDFVEKHPTIKILALSFLLLIGLSLMADGMGQHISKGYIYFAMGFSVFVEMINIRVRKRVKPVQLHQPYTE